MITFATRAVADEWWRAVSTSTNTKYSDSIRRVTPQFFTHDTNQAIAPNSLTDVQVASQFLGKVFFTLLSDRDGPVRVFPVLPPPDTEDHVSGNL